MFLIKSFTFNPVQENTYLIYNESGDCIILDPGCYYDYEQDALRAFVADNALTPVMLVNTHCHLDHVFGNRMVAETYGLKLKAHRLEKDVLDLAPASALMFNLPFDNYDGAIEWIEEGDIISLGDDQLLAIHVPGHSPGSLCFYCSKQKFMIGGDVLFQRSIGRSDLPGGDGPALIKNIKEKLFVLSDDIKVYPGHGPATTIGEEKTVNPFLQ